MNNGYRVTSSGLLVKPDEVDHDNQHQGDGYLPANHAVHTIPMGAVTSSDEDASQEGEIWGAGNAPAPDALDAAVRRARQAVALQDSDELRKAKSPEDMRADLEQARRHRDARRAYDDRVYDDELGELDAQRAHLQKMRRWQRQRDEAAAEAEQRRQQLLDPTTALVRLKRGRTWAPAVALIPGIFAAITGAYNVGTELTRINPATQWVNWLIEPLLTLPIIAILIAQLAGAVPSVAQASSVQDAKEALRNSYVGLEIVLFVLAGALAVGLHFAGTNATGSVGSLVWLVVPLGLAVSMYLVPKLQADLTAKFVAATGALPDAATRGVTPSSYSANGLTTQAAGNRSSTPLRADVITAEVADLVAAGQWSEPVSARRIREHFSCGMDIARVVRDRLKALGVEVAG